MKNKCRKCKQIVARLKKRIKKLSDEKRQLLHENKALKEIIFKTKSCKTKQEVLQNQLQPKKRGAPLGHPGRTRAKPETVDTEIEVHAQKCPHCNSSNLMRCERYDEHIQEDITPPKVVVTKYLHYRYYCKECKNIVTGIGANEIPGSFIGPAARSTACYLHYKSGLSYGKIKDVFEKMFNLKIDKSALYGFDTHAGENGDGIYEEIRNDIKNSDYFHVDETGWPNDGKNRWLWCKANPQAVFYHIDKRRSSSVVKTNIGQNYKGIIITDFLSTYNKLPYKKQKCLVHLLRIVKRIFDRYPKSSRVKDFCNKLKRLIKDILKIHKNINKMSKINFTEQRGDLKSKLKSLLSQSLPYPKVDKFRKKLQNIQHELTMCLDYPYVPPHNNFVERQIRPNVILRKMTFGTRSETGIKNHERMMSIIQTAELNKYPVINLLKDIHTKSSLTLSQLQNKSP